MCRPILHGNYFALCRRPIAFAPNIEQPNKSQESTSPPNDDGAEIELLAALSPLAYDRERERAAEQCPHFVSNNRPRPSSTPAQGTRINVTGCENQRQQQ
jgi:hypothetical protein